METLAKTIEQKKRSDAPWAAAGEVMSGDEWYLMDAFRALNQALGRCIRHVHTRTDRQNWISCASLGTHPRDLRIVRSTRLQL